MRENSRTTSSMRSLVTYDPPPRSDWPRLLSRPAGKCLSSMRAWAVVK
jgi:hypothetical protein